MSISTAVRSYNASPDQVKTEGDRETGAHARRDNIGSGAIFRSGGLEAVTVVRIEHDGIPAMIVPRTESQGHDEAALQAAYIDQLERRIAEQDHRECLRQAMKKSAKLFSSAWSDDSDDPTKV